MLSLPPAVAALIASGPLAHLTTLNADGSPQVSVVWVGLEAGELVVGHLGTWRKVANVRRDPRVALSLLGEGTDGPLRHHLVIYGRARVTEGGGADLLHRLARTYIGPEADFPPLQVRESSPGCVTRITPERFSGVGPWSHG